MNWQQEATEIESIEFDVQLNVVSSFKLFLNAARKEPSVIALYQALQASEEVADAVLDRVCELSRRQIDTRYANTNDTALTVYLWLLSVCRPTHATIGSLCVVGAANCHYAWKVARSVLLPSLAPQSSGDITADWNGQGTEAPSNGYGGWIFKPCPLSNGTRKILTGSAFSVSDAGSPGHT